MADTATAETSFDTRVPWKALDIATVVIGLGLIAYGLTLSTEGVDSARFEFSDALLSGSALIYVFSFVAYLTHLIRTRELPAHIGSFLAWIGAAMHTSGMLVRWTISGWDQPPWTNLYESLLFFAWGIVAVYLFFEWRSKNKSAGAFVLPAAVIMMGLAAFSMPASKEIPQLMPALQSGWIQFHVACASIAYAAFMTAFGFAILFLIKDQLPTSFMTMVYSIFAGITFLAYGGGDVLFHAEFPLKKPTIIGTGELVDAPFPVPYAGQLFLVALILYGAAAALYFAAKKNEDLLRFQRPALIGAFVAHSVGMVQAIYFSKTTFPIPMRPELSLFKWNINAYLIGLVVLVWLGAAFVLLIDWRGERISKKLPAARVLDDWSYKAVLVGLPFMTLNLVTGAIWANNAWGTYWQWDPKETWALITWLTYAAYIHMRMARGWSGRKASSLAIAGFGVVIFTYLGVNLFLSGLHSYGSPG